MISVSLLESALSNLIRQSVRDLKLSDGDGLPDTSLGLPRNVSHGDLVCSIAMQLASRRHKPPLQLAEALASALREKLKGSALEEAVDRLEVKPPGFINFFLSDRFLHSVLQEVLGRGADYGRVEVGQGRKAIVEFVSANPTGPLSVAHGRQAAVGDALANLLAFAGYQVHREYYLNDEGTQIDLIGTSVLARAREAAGIPAQFPENGYKGTYVFDLGKKLLEEKGRAALEGAKAQDEARAFAVRELTAVIRSDLDQFGIGFDEWFPQSSLDEGQFLRKTLDLLKDKGFLYEAEGAWWLKSTAFGDDKDRVVIRSDGRLTYIAADIAYHRRKFERGFGLLVNLWGPDHHGYIARLKAAVQGMGFPPEGLQIRIVQLCTLKRGSETIPMSTREGQFITLTQVMSEVGRDAARFFFLLRKMDAHLEFDLELAKKHTLENPVYYIQYAHARICNILANAKKEGITPGRGDFSALKAPEEARLLRLLRLFPGEVESCARSLEPFGLITTLQELAEALHRFYDAHRVIGVDPALAAARLDLVLAVRTVIATGLTLLGVSAPEKM